MKYMLSQPSANPVADVLALLDRLDRDADAQQRIVTDAVRRQLGGADTRRALLDEISRITLAVDRSTPPAVRTVAARDLAAAQQADSRKRGINLIHETAGGWDGTVCAVITYTIGQLTAGDDGPVSGVVFSWNSDGREIERHEGFILSADNTSLSMPATTIDLESILSIHL